MSKASLAAWLSAALLVASLPLGAAGAEDPQAAAENLRKVREQIEREERRLDQLKKNQDDLQKSVDKLAKEADQAATKKQALVATVDQLRDEGDRITRAVGKLQQDIVDRRTGLTRRIVALYKTQRRTAALDYLFSAKSSTDLLKRTRYLSAVAGYDKNYLQGLGKLVDSLSRDEQRLKEIQQKKRESLAQADALERELSKKREEKALLASEERERVKQQERSLDKLRASADKLEKVLASIMGGDQYQVVEEQPPPEPGEPTETVTTSVSPSNPPVIVAPFGGKGLDGMRGKLLFPVKGEVIQRFGKQKHDEFADMLFVKGLEVKAPVGAKVSAVAEGKIVLSQVLPGYGNVIIVDHGQRYYTLYGRLASSLRSVGDVVKAGEAVAVLGEADYKGRNFYFELRVKGKASNPIEFFREPPPMAKG